MATPLTRPLGVQVGLEKKPLKAVLEDLVSLGCTAVEFHTGVPGFHPHVLGPRKRRSLRQRLEDLHLKVTLHAPESLSWILPFREQVEGSLKALEHLVALAEELGAEALTLHLGRNTYLGNTKVPLEGLEPFEPYQESLKWALDRLATFKFPISIENAGTFHLPWVLRLIEEGLPENLGLTLDLGHLHLLKGGLQDRVRSLFVQHHERIRVLHIHDNDGIRDLHAPPGQGTLPFHALFQSLPLPQTAIAILEVRPYQRVQPSDLTLIAQLLPYNLAAEKGGTP